VIIQITLVKSMWAVTDQRTFELTTGPFTGRSPHRRCAQGLDRERRWKLNSPSSKPLRPFTGRTSSATGASGSSSRCASGAPKALRYRRRSAPFRGFLEDRAASGARRWCRIGASGGFRKPYFSEPLLNLTH
jgi:hypothetical protein